MNPVKIIISNEEWKRIAQLLEIKAEQIVDNNSSQIIEKIIKEGLLILK